MRADSKLFNNSEEGFSLVELLVVIIVSLILLAGMVGLLQMALGQFNQARAIATVTDSARRSLSSIGRQVKSALHFDDANCGANQMAFWGDIDSDNADADVDLYTNAEYVRFYLLNNELMQQITQPSSEGGGMSNVALCSSVQSVRFYYFAQGVRPVYDSVSRTYTNSLNGNFNASTGMVKVVITYRNRGVTRVFEQDMFLRILNRAD